MDVKLEKCRFCGESVEPKPVPQMMAKEYRCKNCGNYVLDNLLSGSLEAYIDKLHLIAGYLAETKAHRDYVGSSSENLQRAVISKDKIESIFTDPIVPRRIMQKLDKLLVFLHKNTNHFGQKHEINKIPPSAAYARNSDEIKAMVQETVNMECGSYRLLEPGSYGWGGGGQEQLGLNIDKNVFILNTKGHSRAEDILTRNVDTKKVFVTMAFRDDLVHAMDEAIRPACSECGFEAMLVSDVEHNNGITDEIIVGIKSSKFVITDFTYNNSGAYFEAGYAQGYGLEVIRCCKKDWLDGNDEKGNKNKLHFDVNHYNFIIWKDFCDLYAKLVNRIRATIPNAYLT